MQIFRKIPVTTIPQLIHTNVILPLRLAHCGPDSCNPYGQCDDLIKWQWAVRYNPKSQCLNACVPKLKCVKRRNWLMRFILRNRKYPVDLDNCPVIIKKEPKWWELEFYSYILPEKCTKPKPPIESCRLFMMKYSRPCSPEELDDTESGNTLCASGEEWRNKVRSQLSSMQKTEKAAICSYQPCSPPTYAEPRWVRLKKACLGNIFSRGCPADMEKYLTRFPYEEYKAGLKTTCENKPKELICNTICKKKLNKMPHESDSEVKLLCQVHYKSGQHKYIDCPKALYSRFKNVHFGPDVIKPITCECNIFVDEQKATSNTPTANTGSMECT